MPTIKAVTPELGVPFVRGMAIPCIIGAACIKARYPGNYATFGESFRLLGRRARKYQPLMTVKEVGSMIYATVRDRTAEPQLEALA